MAAASKTCATRVLSAATPCQTVWLKHYVNAGAPTPDHFDVRATTLDLTDEALPDGAIVVRARALSVDPYVMSLPSQCRAVSPPCLEASVLFRSLRISYSFPRVITKRVMSQLT